MLRRSLALALVSILAMSGAGLARTRFDPVPLPVAGAGSRIPAPWAARGLNFGTAALVALVKRAARTVRAADPGATLFVADMSPRRGGASEWHRSHRTGRDVDLLFFAVDQNGEPAPPPSQMVPFDDEGVSWRTRDDGSRMRVEFDIARNWELVKALLDDDAHVTNVFIYAPLRDLLLAYAEQEGESRGLIERAAEIMSQPGDSLPHNDHMHVRIEGPQGFGYARAGKNTHRASRSHASRPGRVHRGGGKGGAARNKHAKRV